jgi:hypothetical protein
MAFIIQRARLRRYFPGADGRANPLQWFVLDPAYESCDGTPMCIAGPFRKQREAFAAADREARDACAAEAAIQGAA